MFNRIKNALSSISPGFHSQVENSFRYRNASPQDRERILKFAAAAHPAIKPAIKYPARPVASTPKSFSSVALRSVATRLNDGLEELNNALVRYAAKKNSAPKLTGLALTAAAIKPQVESLAARTAEPPEFKLPDPPAGGFRSHAEVTAFYSPLLAAAKERMAVAERAGHIPQNLTTLRPSINRAWNQATAQVFAANRK